MAMVAASACGKGGAGGRGVGEGGWEVGDGLVVFALVAVVGNIDVEVNVVVA